jgi:DNA ligase (NAD+)
VKRACVHNLSIIRELGLGIGDHIEVYKAGKIIPQIYGCAEKSGGIKGPSVCPVCGAVAEHRTSVNRKSEFFYCTNNACAARKKKQRKGFLQNEAV